MKSKILTVLFSLSFSFNTFATLGRESGGGNMLGGRMIESYIVDPTTISDAQALNERLMVIKEKNIDLFSLISKGLIRPTWYFIPGTLKELSENITGIPFTSEQIAIQNFDTNEIWIDETLYKNSQENGLINNIERQKLLAHEALLGGYNSFLLNIGNTIPSLLDGSGITMPKFKKMVRTTVSLIFDPNLKAMTNIEVADHLKDIGWNMKPNGSLICFDYYVGDERSGARIYDSIPCSEVDQYFRNRNKDK